MQMNLYLENKICEMFKFEQSAKNVCLENNPLYGILVFSVGLDTIIPRHQNLKVSWEGRGVICVAVHLSCCVIIYVCYHLMTVPVYIHTCTIHYFNVLFSTSVQLEHANDRYRLLDNQTSSIKKELEALRSKNLQLSNALSSHQAAINTTTHELLSSRERLSKAEVAVNTVRAERDLMESGERRARSLYEELLREQRGHQVESYCS